MTRPEDAIAPQAAAEQDPRDPSRAANQVRDEPIPPGPADDDTPAADSSARDAGDRAVGREPQRRQSGVPENTVTDTTPAPGTSEEMAPVQGTHTPDVGPGGKQIDTA